MFGASVTKILRFHRENRKSNKQVAQIVEREKSRRGRDGKARKVSVDEFRKWEELGPCIGTFMHSDGAYRLRSILKVPCQRKGTESILEGWSVVGTCRNFVADQAVS